MDEKHATDLSAWTGKNATRAHETPLSRESKARVLLVDDDPVVLEVLTERLREAGYEVYTREASLGTSQWLADKRPDLVVLDVNMPALSGGELAQVIHRRPSLRRTGVILYSSVSQEELEEMVRRAGALGAISKASDERTFMAAFERLALKHRVQTLQNR